MINQTLLREKMREQRYSVRSLGKAIPMSEPAIGRKVRGTVDFKAGEIERVSELLQLTDKEILAIFFGRE